MTTHDPNLTMLSRREQTILAAIGNAFFPPKGPIAVSGTEAGVVRYFDRYLARSARLQRVLMRLLFTFIELSPFPFGPRRKPFTKLDHADRLTLLDGMSKSRIYFRRVSFISIRALMTMAYLSDGRVAQAMGMAPNKDPFGLDEHPARTTDEIAIEPLAMEVAS